MGHTILLMTTALLVGQASQGQVDDGTIIITPLPQNSAPPSGHVTNYRLTPNAAAAPGIIVQDGPVANHGPNCNCGRHGQAEQPSPGGLTFRERVRAWWTPSSFRGENMHLPGSYGQQFYGQPQIGPYSYGQPTYGLPDAGFHHQYPIYGASPMNGHPMNGQLVPGQPVHLQPDGTIPPGAIPQGAIPQGPPVVIQSDDSAQPYTAGQATSRPRLWSRIRDFFRGDQETVPATDMGQRMPSGAIRKAQPTGEPALLQQPGATYLQPLPSGEPHIGPVGPVGPALRPMPAIQKGTSRIDTSGNILVTTSEPPLVNQVVPALDMTVTQTPAIQPVEFESESPVQDGLQPEDLGIIHAAFARKLGHEEDYSWITGQLARTSKGWVIHYTTPGTVDPYDGQLPLESSVNMSHIRDGDLVCVQGTVTGPTTHHVYRVTAVHLIDRR